LKLVKSVINYYQSGVGRNFIKRNW